MYLPPNNSAREYSVRFWRVIVKYEHSFVNQQSAKLTSRVEILNIRICAFVSASCVYNFLFCTSASSCNQAANFIFRSGFVGSYLNNKPLLRSSQRLHYLSFAFFYNLAIYLNFESINKGSLQLPRRKCLTINFRMANSKRHWWLIKPS